MLKMRWDMIIAHPPCTYLSGAGNRYFNVEKYGDSALERIEKREEAFDFFMKFANANCDRVAVENPVGYPNSHFRKPDQTIHPWYFAEDENDTKNYHFKRTCWWLKGLPKLEYSKDLEPPKPIYVEKSGKKRYYTDAHSGYSKDAKEFRSKTFPGIAKAIAEQWAGQAADEENSTDLERIEKLEKELIAIKEEI